MGISTIELSTIVFYNKIFSTLKHLAMHFYTIESIIKYFIVHCDSMEFSILIFPIKLIKLMCLQWKIRLLAVTIFTKKCSIKHGSMGNGIEFTGNFQKPTFHCGMKQHVNINGSFFVTHTTKFSTLCNGIWKFPQSSFPQWSFIKRHLAMHFYKIESIIK